MIVTAKLESIRIGAATGFDAVPYGLAVSQFDARMSFTLVGMPLLVALLALWMLRSRELDAAKRAGT